MTQCHDFAVVAFRDDLKTRGKGTSLDDQRVVSPGIERHGQIGKESSSVMPDCG